MARRRSSDPASPPPVPVELQYRPVGSAITPWVTPDAGSDAASVEIQGFYAWIDARHAWAAEHGLTYAAFRRYDEPVIIRPTKER